MTIPDRPMNAAAVRLLLSRIATTVDDEPDFDGAESLMARYVDERVSGRNDPATSARLEAHLRQSSESVEIVSVLEDLAIHEAAATLPDVDELWAELRSSCRPPRSPEQVSPTPDRVKPDSGIASWLRQVPARWYWPRPVVAARAMLIALLLVTSVGWWRASSRADESDVLMETVAGATAVRFQRMGDGAWARVAYDPDDSHALVWVGGLPRVDDGERFECWFAGRDGGRSRARALVRMHGDPQWFHLETDSLVESFDRFLMTREPRGDVVVEVALHDPGSRP